MSEWKFPERLPAFKPKENSALDRVFKDQIALVTYAQYKRKHIVEKNENLWLPHFALLFSKIVKSLRAAGSLSFELAFAVWWHLWRMNPMYLSMGYHTNSDNFKEMIAAIMPYINGELKLKLIQEEDKFFLVTLKETTP